MKAVAERIPGTVDSADTIIWHRPIGRVVEEFQAIRCSDDEGITLPSGVVDVPARLDQEGESWCIPCRSSLVP